MVVAVGMLGQKALGPRFGCRQIAFMTEGDGPTAQQQAMLLEALTDNANSLKAQSTKRKHPHRDGVKEPLHEEDLLKNPLKGNADGWGVASYAGANGDSLQIQRSLKSAAEDTRFDAAATEASERAPRTMLAHILNKVDRNRILKSEEDVHPFSFENWSAMFNGVLDGARTPEMTNIVNTTSCPTLGCTPKGTNSGEKILLYFMAKLKAQFGTTNSQGMTIAQLVKGFGETMRDFLQKSQPVYRPLDGTVSGLKGQIQLGPGCNYIVTDGKVLLAFRKGRKLYLNRHPAGEGKFGYLVSSEPIHPKGQSLTWMELPQDHILALSKAADGCIEPTLTPLSLALTS